MQMSYLYASDFPFKNFSKIAQHTETKTYIWEKSTELGVLVVGKSTDHDKPYFDFYVVMFLRRQRKCFLSERELKKALRDTLTRARGWDLVIFDWFVLSMRMQVILDSSFARPGSVPIWGGKKGEFRDWTISCCDYSYHFTSHGRNELNKSTSLPASLLMCGFIARII